MVDNEFTQLMKGLQGERLRQAFHYLDKDEDGFIRSEEFKRIILVCNNKIWLLTSPYLTLPVRLRKLPVINYQRLSSTGYPLCVP